MAQKYNLVIKDELHNFYHMSTNLLSISINVNKIEKISSLKERI